MTDQSPAAEQMPLDAPEDAQEPAQATEGQVTTITQAEAAGQQDTSEDGLVPPGATAYAPGHTVPPEHQVLHLEAYLASQFPDEVHRTNYQVPETPVDTAIRLLSGLHAQVAVTNPQARCPEQYCNKPVGHRDAHGWVHFG
jgi:hypothetical protein